MTDTSNKGIDNKEYFMCMLEEFGNMPARDFFGSDSGSEDDLLNIEYILVTVDAMPEETALELAKKITVKDFLYIFIEELKHQLEDSILREKYESNIEKITMETYVLAEVANSQRKKGRLFRDMCEVNYATFHDTLFELIEKNAHEEDITELGKIKGFRKNSMCDARTLNCFLDSVIRTMNVSWPGITSIHEFKKSVLDAHSTFLKGFVLPLCYGINADVWDSQTIDKVVRKYV